jgi:hypothetical protein
MDGLLDYWIPHGLAATRPFNSNYYVAQAASLLYRPLPVGKRHSAIRVEKFLQNDKVPTERQRHLRHI